MKDAVLGINARATVQPQAKLEVAVTLFQGDPRHAHRFEKGFSLTAREFLMMELVTIMRMSGTKKEFMLELGEKSA